MGNPHEIRRVLRHRDFRLLWLAQSASVIGDNIVLVALSLFIIERTDSASDLGLVLAAQVLALVAFLLLGGVWADRLPRHRVMVATDLVRFALHALLAILIFAGRVAIWQLVVIEVLFRSAEAFFRPAANGLLPQTVPEPDIQPATAATTLSENVALFAGPALATALVLGAGAAWAFVLDAATFLLSAVLLVRVHPRPRRPAAGARGGVLAQRSSVWQEIREGAREVRSRVWVWATLASFCVALFCGLASWFVLGPLVAREQYGHLGVYGALEAALGLGTIAGSLLGLAWRPRFPMRMAMIATLLWPLVDVLYAEGVTLALVAPAMVIAGVGFALFNIWWLTALAERIPAHALSRVTSYDWMVSYALLPLGYLIVGPLASRLGAVHVLAGGSALAAAAFAVGLAPRETRALERLAVAPEDVRARVALEESLGGRPRRS